jgi:hypothetical protein
MTSSGRLPFSSIPLPLPFCGLYHRTAEFHQWHDAPASFSAFTLRVLLLKPWLRKE